MQKDTFIEIAQMRVIPHILVMVKVRHYKLTRSSFTYCLSQGASKQDNAFDRARIK